MNSIKKAIERIRYAYDNHPSYLSLSGLGLRALPEEIHTLPDLYELDLAHNLFNEIPREISKFKKLRRLDLSHNCLNSVIGIGTQYIDYSRYYSVNFSNNNFRFVIDEFYELLSGTEEITSFNFDGNEFYVEPPEFYDYNGLASVLYYSEYIRENKHESILSEAKLVVVGQGEVGKTSIINKLVEKIDEKETVNGIETTRGVDIVRWKIPTYLEDERTLALIHYGLFEDLNYNDFFLDASGDLSYETLVHIWDFGGQEIYYNVHQVFLTKKALYILVWDARKEETLENFDYWINIISLLSQNSPVIIVMNKADVRVRNIDGQLLKKKYHNIKFLIQTSCVTGEGIDELREIIQEEIYKLPSIGVKIPKAFIEIKEALLTKNDDFISLGEYIKIYESINKDKSKINDNAKIFLNTLNEIGSIIYNDNDQILENIIVLNPEWITKAFYSLIDDKQVQKNYGRFDFRALSRIWDLKIYPIDKHIHLLRYLEISEIAFNLLGTQDYIIPDLLPHDPKSHNVEFKKASTSRFEYKFSFIPKGILPRFICRNHTMIFEDKYWKYGTVLQYKEAFALVNEDRFGKSIKVSVGGEGRVFLLGLIRNEFEKIFSNLEIKKNIDYKEYIPCICSECVNNEPHFFDFPTLEKYLEKFRETITCPKSIEDINIWEAVNGYRKHKDNPPVFHNLLKACSNLQGNHQIIASNEDSRNKFIATILKQNGFIASDQTRWGRSATGKSQGEIDILIESGSNVVLSVFEGFNLKGLDTAKILLHYRKIFKYDSNGLQENYLVIYNDSDDFISLWQKYSEIIAQTVIDYKIVEQFLDISKRYSHGSDMKIGKTTYIRNQEHRVIYHVFVNMNYEK